MLIFFKLDEYYIFRKKDLEILKNISSNILNSLGVKFYKNIGFKVHKDKAKTFLVYLIENTNKSIVLLDKVGKFYLKYIYINS
jgi:hypothetical protein